MSPMAGFTLGFTLGVAVGGAIVLLTAWLIAEWYWRREEALWQAELARDTPAAPARAIL